MSRLFGAAAAALLAACLTTAPALAQGIDRSVLQARPSATISAAAGPLDEARGRRVAESAAASAAAGADTSWTDGLASGTIRLDAEAGGCRTFFVRQTAPSGSPPLIGRVCRAGAGWQVQAIGPAAAAGPRGEPRVTDGVTRDVVREPPPLPKKDSGFGERAESTKPFRDYGSAGASGGKADSGLGAPSKPMSSSGPPPSPPKPPPPAPEPPPTRSEPPPPPAPGNTTGAGSSAGGGVVRTTSAVLVEIGPREARKPRNGGSAVVLLSERTDDAARNLRTCRALFRALDTATTGEITTGQRRTEDGGIEKLRPVYWLWKARPTPPASGDACPMRLASYDFARAGSIRTKYGLTGRGPYLVIARGDELRAGVVDLGAAPIGETEDLVRYFRDGFSQEAEIWSPERHTPAKAQQSLVAFLGRSIPGVALTALVRPVAVATCPLGDFFDVCTPAPR